MGRPYCETASVDACSTVEDLLSLAHLIYPSMPPWNSFHLYIINNYAEDIPTFNEPHSYIIWQCMVAKDSMYGLVRSIIDLHVFDTGRYILKGIIRWVEDRYYIYILCTRWKTLLDYLFLFLISRWYYYYILCQSHLLSWNNHLRDNLFIISIITIIHSFLRLILQV